MLNPSVLIYDHPSNSGYGTGESCKSCMGRGRPTLSQSVTKLFS
ncbi:MAG: hypothetical protein ACYTXC_24240 [Nostoc sp.]